jgi:hypothetical protein
MSVAPIAQATTAQATTAQATTAQATTAQATTAPIVTNPQNILKSGKSNITTNPFIPKDQKDKEMIDLNNEIEYMISKNINSKSLMNLSIRELNSNIANSVINVMDDMFNKPQDINWISYTIYIIQKEDRYTYLGLLFLFISIYMYLVYV